MRKLVFLLAGAVLAASLPAAAAPRLSGQAKLAQELEGRVAGEAVNCISLSRAQSTRIIENSAIVYRSGGTLYVNRPRLGADSLSDRDTLLTRTFGSQLCSGDVVQMIDPATGHMRGLVFLDEFVPYKRAR